MNILKFIERSCYLCALLAQAAGATTIIQSSGNSEASVPLGYYAPYASFNGTPIVFAVGWTQSSAYSNVDVFANLFTPGSNGTVDYALVTQIGPGTSFTADGIVRGSVSTPTNPTDVDLFHLDTLPAGTYYLVLDSPTPNTSWQYNYPYQTNNTTDTGVNYLGSAWAYGPSIYSSYTAGSNFSGVNIPVEFRVSGTAAAPEPATFGGTGLVLVGLSLVLRRLRNCRGN